MDPTEKFILKLEERKEGWDGYSAPPVKQSAIKAAIEFNSKEIADFFDEPPHVSSDEEGNVTLEWWRNKRKITIYVSEKEITYLKVWGINIFSEMSDGVYKSGQLKELVKWMLEKDYD